MTTKDNLRSDPKNARLHPDKNKAMIRRSLEEVGGFRSIAIDGDDIVRAGNGVFEQAQELGMEVRVVDADPNEIIAVRRKDLKGDAAIRAALYDNAASDTSTFDSVVIQDILQSERHLLDGILTDQDLARILSDETSKGSDLIDLGFDAEGSSGFSEGTQFKDAGMYDVTIEVPTVQFEKGGFKDALAEFCGEHGLQYKTRMR